VHTVKCIDIRQRHRHHHSINYQGISVVLCGEREQRLAKRAERVEQEGERRIAGKRCRQCTAESRSMSRE
jgi:hypothetical protein